MQTELIHQRENSEDTESFLKENGEKFTRQCVQVLQLLYSGKKFSAKEVNDILDIADGGRRLRDIFASRKDCKREWQKGGDGKRKCVVYWLEIPSLPTKQKLQEAGKVISIMEKISNPPVLETVFSLPDIPNDNKPESYHQPTLFDK